MIFLRVTFPLIFLCSNVIDNVVSVDDNTTTPKMKTRSKSSKHSSIADISSLSTFEEQLDMAMNKDKNSIVTETKGTKKAKHLMKSDSKFCDDSPGIDAAFYSSEYDAYYFFKGNQYTKSTKAGGFKMPSNYPMSAHSWGVPTQWDSIDAAFYSEQYKAYYFFKGRNYVKSSASSKWKHGPISSSTAWGVPADWDHIDAAFYAPQWNAYYFFKGRKYTKASAKGGWKVPRGYPKGTAGWGVPTNWASIDAALYSPDPEYNAFYYFKGSRYSKANSSTGWKKPSNYPMGITSWGVPAHWVTKCFSSYLGCFNDEHSRALPHRRGYGSVDDCTKKCGNAGYKYAGRQHAGECWCGNKGYRKYGKTTGCECHGENVGDWKNCVYKIKK